MPPRREIVTELDPHYYGILSAWVKSMRVSNPVDSLYYLKLLRLTTSGLPAHIQMRTLVAGAEDGFAVRAMTHQLEWQYQQKAERAIKGAVLAEYVDLSVYNIAAQASAYNSGEMGLGWNWTDDWQVSWFNKSRRAEVGECTEAELRKGVWDLPPALDRDGYLYALRFWRMHQNYGRPWEPLHKLAADWARHRADVMEDVTLGRFAEAYKPMSRWLAQEHGGLAENWFRRLLYFAARGTKGVKGKTPKFADPDFEAAEKKAQSLFNRRAKKGIIKIPSYAYDGRHCWADKGVKDARFCGDASGNINMYAMAERDGFLDVHAQGITKTVEDKWLSNPYLTFKVEFPTLVAL